MPTRGDTPNSFASRAQLRAWLQRHHESESKPTALAKRYASQLAANRKAYDYFRAEAPWYRRTTCFYVMCAKQEATRQRRLADLIACCEQQRRIGVLDRK